MRGGGKRKGGGEKGDGGRAEKVKAVPIFIQP